MKTSISKMLSRVIALALVFCLSAQMMPLQIMANDYNNQQLDEQIADKQSEIEKLETEVENMLGHEIGVNAAAEAQSAPVMMAANTEVTNVSDESAFTFDASTGTITGFTAPSGSYTVTIPSTIGGVAVTTIGYNAFKDKSGLTAITIPEGVTTIEGYYNNGAFQNCTSLESVTLPNTLETIGQQAFTGTTALTSLTTLPDSLRTIEYRAFYNSGAQFTELDLTKLTRLNKEAFYGTTLTKVILPASCDYVVQYDHLPVSTFAGQTSLTEVVFEEGATKVPNSMFSGCTNLESVTLPDTVTYFGMLAFSGCSSLSEIDLSNVEVIDVGALKGTSLVNVTLNDYITEISDSMFADCVELESVTANNITRIGSNAFDGCTSLITLPDMTNVSDIGGHAFKDCTSLTQLDLYAKNEDLSLGLEILINCENLKKITIHGDYTTSAKNANVGPFALTPANIEFIFDGNPEEIGDYLFDHAPFFDDDNFANLPSSVKQYGEFAFAYTPLTEIKIPENIVEVYAGAFANCDSLVKVTVLNDVLAWMNLYAYEDTGRWPLKNMGFFSGTALADLEVADDKTDITFPSDWTMIPHGFFAGSEIRDTEFLEDMPNLKEIDSYAFFYCRKLENLVIPEGVTTIGERAFRDSMEKVKVLTIPASVTTLVKDEYNGHTQQFSEVNIILNSLTDVYIHNPALYLYDKEFATTAMRVFVSHHYSTENPLIIHGVVDEDGNSTAKDLCDVSGGIYVFETIGTVGSVSLIVTKDGHQLADGFEVVWKNADGVVQPSTMGENGTVTFKPHATGLEFTYQITLTDDELLANYYIPQLGTVISSEEPREITETLAAIPEATFTVNAPSGALVKLTQNINGVVTVSEYAVENNSVTINAKKAYTEIAVSLDGYYTEYAVISDPEETNTVEITMTALPAVSVPLNATSIIDGETELIDVTGFDFTVKNGETPVNVRLEGNMLYPDEEIAADTILTIAFESEGDLIAPEPVSFTFSDEDVDVQFKKRGHIEMTVSNWTNVDADGFLLWIFDLESGDLVEAYDMFYGICETDPLEAGTYNIVAIDRSVGIESVPNVSALKKFGLENNHYYQKATAVSDGFVTDLGAIAVPDYEKFGGALYVDMFEYANFESTVIEPTIGQNFILTLDYKLNDTYSSTAEKEIIVQLPNGTYVNACYTPEGTGSFEYDEKDSFLTVKTTVNEGQIYLSLTGREANYYSTAVASAKIGAYTAKPVSFDLPIKDIYIEAYDVTNGKLFDREITVYTAPFADVMLYVNGEPYQKANSNNGLYEGESVSSGGLGIAKFTVSLPGPATSGTRWKLTAKATVLDKDSNNYITYESAGEKIINYYIDPFGVVISTQYPWCAQADAAGASVNYSSVQRGVQSYWMTRCPYYAWNAGVNDGMGKYIKDGTIYVKLSMSADGHDAVYLPMKATKENGDVFNAITGSLINHNYMDYYFDVTDEFYTEFLSQPVPVTDYSEAAAEKQASQDALLAELEEFEVEYGNLSFEDIEAMAENDYDRAALLEFKALMTQAAYEASGIAGVDDIRDMTDDQLIEEMGITKTYIMAADLQDYANNSDFIKVEEDGAVTHYIYRDAQKTISVDVNELTVTTYDYTARQQTYALRKSARSSSTGEAAMAAVNSGMKQVEEKIKETQNTLSSVQFAIENVTEAADKYAKDSKLSDTLKEVLSGKAKKVAELGGKALNHALTAYNFWEWGNYTAEMSEIKLTMSSLLNEYIQVKLADSDEYKDKQGCLNAIDSLIAAYKDLFDALMNKMLSLSAQLLLAFVSILAAIPSFGVSLLVNLITMLIGFKVDAVFDENIEMARSFLKMRQREKSWACRPDEDESEDDVPCRPYFDPSGYVYEGVFSNRVEGLEVTTYTKSDNGMPWDASTLEQQNPLITNEIGYYRWDVPVGEWKVVVSENTDYYSADTTDIYRQDYMREGRNDITEDGWHQVLPIQTEVHIPVVSKHAPEVESALAYSDSIIVQFSQYMKEETVEDKISVTMGGEPFTGEALTIEWPDREMSDHYYNRTFASMLKISRADGETWTDKVTVSITGGENYAGTKMENPYSVNLDVIPVIDEIENDGTAYVEYGESEDVTITLRDASGNGITGIPVEITTGGYAVFEEAKGNETAEKISISAVSDENGQVTFTVMGKYPGDDTIVVIIPGRDESLTIPVVIKSDNDPAVSEPVVTINGTEYRGQGHSVTVPSGTVITVTGENAEKLYYAIGENACPCQDDQIEITGNRLTLTESGYYKFAAFADGVYSSRVHINITVTNEGGAGSGEGESGGSGTGTGGTAPVAPVTPPSAENNFTDVAENAYYYDAVMWALENGITTGVSEDKFAPDMECSRAQAVTFLWRAAGEPKPKDSSMLFSDVAENAYYRDAVLWAVENGITNGTGEDSFSPDMKCTREQIVTFLWRTAKHLGMDVSVGEDTNILSYDDAFDIGEWAIPAVQWACGAGVMNGTSESALSPQMVCSRAQIVTFLYRTFK